MVAHAHLLAKVIVCAQGVGEIFQNEKKDNCINIGSTIKHNCIFFVFCFTNEQVV
jgi:hypothetical protein